MPPQEKEINIGELQKDIDNKIKNFGKEVNKLQKEYENTFNDLQKKGYKIDKDMIPIFMKKFWHTYPTKNINEWEVAIPNFIPFNIGWFDRVEGGYNIFIINKYTRWFGEEIPAFISHEINIPSPLKIAIDGLDLNFPEEKQEQIEKSFGQHLSLIGKNKATIKQGHEFDLIAEIIDSGSLPFTQRPINSDDLMESDFIQIWDELNEKYESLKIFEGKYSYQGKAWELFFKYGALGIFWGMSFGKTVIGTYIFSRIKGRKALIIPTITLKEQWEQFFKLNCPRLSNEIEIYTYQGMSRKTWAELRKKEFALIGFDEAHFLPADSFSKLATLKTKYRFGLSSTPYREDNRSNYIMALTGYPTGLDWKTIMQVLGKEYHTVNVHIVKDLNAKFTLTKQLYNPERRTIIFVNLLDIGSKISEMLEIPFISGETKKRLEIIKKTNSFVASRVLELGISIKDLEHIIEVDFLFGSRREEMQRTGRLMHSLAEGKIHDIIMTKDELEQYGKRLYGLHEKGFKYNLIPHLTGIISTQDIKTKKNRIPTSSKNYSYIITQLFQEGFFVNERTLSNICNELQKRGITINTAIRTAVFTKLNGLVKTEKLYKIKTEKGYQFKQR
jgi:DNA excision repair protein ERCC-3